MVASPKELGDSGGPGADAAADPPSSPVAERSKCPIDTLRTTSETADLDLAVGDKRIPGRWAACNCHDDWHHGTRKDPDCQQHTVVPHLSYDSIAAVHGKAFSQHRKYQAGAQMTAIDDPNRSSKVMDGASGSAHLMATGRHPQTAYRHHGKERRRERQERPRARAKARTCRCM